MAEGGLTAASQYGGESCGRKTESALHPGALFNTQAIVVI